MLTSTEANAGAAIMAGAIAAILELTSIFMDIFIIERAAPRSKYISHVNFFIVLKLPLLTKALTVAKKAATMIARKRDMLKYEKLFLEDRLQGALNDPRAYLRPVLCRQKKRKGDGF